MLRISSNHINSILKNVATSSQISFLRMKPNGSVVFKRSFFSKTWLDNNLPWFNSPKGFGRYAKNKGVKESENNSSSASKTEKSSGSSEGGSGGSGSGGGKRNPTKESENNSSSASKTEKSSGPSEGGSGGSGSGGGKRKPTGEFSLSPLVTSLVVFGTLNFAIQYIGNNRMSREISWHDFQMKLLETGSVDRIIVTNNKVARVVLKPNANADILDKVTGGVSNKAYSNSSSSLPSSIFNASDSNTTNLDSSKGASSWHESDNFGPQSSASGAQSGGEVDVTLQKGPNAANPDLSRYPSIDDNGSPQISFYFNIGTVDSFERKLEEAQRALGISPRNYIPVVYSNETDLFQEALRFLPTLLLMGGMVWLTGRAMGGGRGDGPGGIFRFGKSTAKKIEKEQVKTTFAHVAGCDEAKREIMEFVQFLKDPKKFTDLGAKIPKGALLCGPPGTGKTLLAKATAGEADVPFYAISGSDFVEMFVGVGPSRVRDLFEEARNNAPCIIFIDEIDAVGRQRGKGGFSGGNDERENTLNQLLVEMDGFDKSTNIVILAGTNRSDILDAALTRPGRFDRQIMVDRPDIKGRKQIFEIYLKDITLDDKMEDISGRLAALTPGFVGADIANICNEAAIVAARRNKKAVQLEDFESATDRVIGGLESRKIMSPEEKKVVAYHEAGHAIAGWFLEHADPLLKVTIVPRGSGALGFAQYLPKELFLRTRDQIMDMVCMALAGRAAEEVNFGRVTTGAADDLRRVTQIVYQMVTVYGMNDKIGQVAFPKEEGSFPGDRLYSDATAEVMDEEVRQIVAAAYERTLNLMRTKKNEVGKVAEVLLSKETITNMDIASLIGRRPFAGNKEYDEYINFGWKGDVKETSEEGSENKESKEKPDEKTDDELSEKLLPV